MKKKTVALLLALTLVVGGVIGGTVAYLTAHTEEVKNTFTVGNIGITLTETMNTDTDNDGTLDKWVAKIAPGYEYEKNPVVTVTAKSEDCYLFVKFTESENIKNYVEYTSMLNEANDWTQGDGAKIPKDVWYRVVNSSSADQPFHLLVGDKVSISTNLSKQAIDNLNNNDITFELTYKAAAVQLHKNNTENFTADVAYGMISAQLNG